MVNVTWNSSALLRSDLLNFAGNTCNNQIFVHPPPNGRNMSLFVVSSIYTIIQTQLTISKKDVRKEGRQEGRREVARDV
jgi:hypothetical protein